MVQWAVWLIMTSQLWGGPWTVGLGIAVVAWQLLCFFPLTSPPGESCEIPKRPPPTP